MFHAATGTITWLQQKHSEPRFCCTTKGLWCLCKWRASLQSLSKIAASAGLDVLSCRCTSLPRCTSVTARQMWPLASTPRASSQTGMPCISLGSTCYTYQACCWRRQAITACSLPVVPAKNGKQPPLLLLPAALSPVLAVTMLSCRLLGSGVLWEPRNNLQGLSSLCKVALHASMLPQYLLLKLERRPKTGGGAHYHVLN